MHNLRASNQTCKLLAAIGLPMAFRVLNLKADRGDLPLDRHLRFFSEDPQRAALVEELSITGRSMDAAVDVMACCVLSADDTAHILLTFPKLRALALNKCFWEGGFAHGPLPSFRNLTSLTIHDATLLEPAPFPANILRHMTFVERTSLSFAPCTLFDSDAPGDLLDFLVPVLSLHFPPTVPFPAAYIRQVIRAAKKTLKELVIELTPVVHAPLFLEFPEDLTIREAELLGSFKLKLPVFAFPNRHAANCTWSYARSMLLSVSPDIPEISIIFDCGYIDSSDSYSRLAAFPTQQLHDFLDGLSESTQVHFTLLAPASSAVPQWADVYEFNQDWERIEQRKAVTFHAVLDEQDTSSFALPYATYEGDGEEIFLWWDSEE